MVLNMVSPIERQPKMAATYVAEQLGITIQALHKIAKKENITLPKVRNKSYLTHEIARKCFNLPFKAQKIAFQIVKGGTGKTTAIHNISCCASLYGAKVLAIDIDPQGNLTDSFGYNPGETPVLIDVLSKSASINDAIIQVEEGIDLLPSRIENVVLDNKIAVEGKALHTLFEKALGSIEKNYDFIFIDCPPTMGHSVSAAALYTGMVITPLNADKYSSKGLNILKDGLESLKAEFKTNIDYKVFLNRFSGNTILSDKAIQTTIAEENEVGKALSIAVRQAQEIPNNVDLGFNLFSNLNKSTARDDFDALTRELLNINLQEDRLTKTRQQTAMDLE